jgi:perosamine synthetase
MNESNLKKNFLPFALPLIGEDEKREVMEVLESGWITTGPKVKQFEQAFASFVGSKRAIAVNSCTAALHLALEAIGIKEGDEVLTTPMTFAATAEVIRYFKAVPVFVDIEPETLNIDVEKAEAKVSQLKAQNLGLKAIIPVHMAGQPCDMDYIMRMAEKYDLKVIEDAAHTFPSAYNGRNIGTIGDITCFSFYATKTITTGEGGMITTESDEYADRMRIMSLHGISRDAWKRYTSEGNWHYEIIAAGYKYNMTDIAAALGLAQLKKAQSMQERRKYIASRYTEAFKNLPEIVTPSAKGEVTHAWHLYIVKLNLEMLSIERDRFVQELKDRGIGASVHFIPLHIHPYYRDTYGFKPEDFPVAFKTYKRIISLPVYPKMTEEDVERVIAGVTDVCKRFGR